MRIHVDFSVYTPSKAIGNVHGTMELDALPRIGESIAFNQPMRGVDPLQVDGFVPLLKVDDVLHTPKAAGTLVAFSLADVVVPTLEDARSLFAYFEKGFGLYADEYEDN